jgi:uncharacterized zinc-type alcohol dehydrogenase-like protein
MPDNIIHAYSASGPNEALKPFEFDAGALKPEDVEIAVESCGICYSDVSMLKNEWGIAQFPLVPGHEVVGKVLRAGEQARGIQAGQSVGVGWYASSCMHCLQCMGGHHNLCAEAQGTIVGRHGGYADKIRAHWSHVIPLPEGVDSRNAGPLFCGGITVFNPIVQNKINSTARVGVVGIGGLGHMALQFLNKWGCEVTAFTSTDAKAEEAKKLGAHHVIHSRDDSQLATLAGQFDMILVTAYVSLNWNLYVNALAPRGTLHFVGAVLEPLDIAVFPIIMGQKSISASPVGSPSTIKTMLEFCARHKIAPVTNHYNMSEVNEALEHLKSGKARFRVVLDNA